MDATLDRAPESDPSPPGTPPTVVAAMSRRRLLGLVGLAGIGAVGAAVLRPRLGGDATAGASTPASTAPTSTTAVSTPTTVAPSRGVAMLGDSITYMSLDALTRAIAPVASLSLVGRPGYTIDQLMPDAEAGALTNPAAVIIDLGTNDALNKVSTVDSLVALDSMLSLFSRATPVLVTVNTHFGDAAAQARAAAINAHIRSLGVRVADWDARVGAELAAGLPDGAITIDEVHPTARGQKVLAGLIAAALPASVFV